MKVYLKAAIVGHWEYSVGVVVLKNSVVPDPLDDCLRIRFHQTGNVVYSPDPAVWRAYLTSWESWLVFTRNRIFQDQIVRRIKKLKLVFFNKNKKFKHCTSRNPSTSSEPTPFFDKQW